MEFRISVFSSNLRAERARAGMTLDELSEASGVSISTIFSYERGQSIPRVDKMYALAQALNIEPNKLCGWEGVEDGISSVR